MARIAGTQQDRNTHFQSELDTSVMGQAVQHPDAEPATSIANPDIMEAALAKLQHGDDAVIEAFSDDAEFEEVPPEEMIIEGGMTMRDLEALLAKANEDVADYDDKVQRHNANQHREETLVKSDVAAGTYGTPEGANSRFASAEKHEKRADQENDAAHRNLAMRGQSEGIGARANKALEAAPTPDGPKGPMGA